VTGTQLARYRYDTEGTAMDVRVDRELCEANAVCCGLAPAVFDLDDDEQLVIATPIDPAEEDRVRKAVERCPKNALAVTGG
jgi:ferredoxin